MMKHIIPWLLSGAVLLCSAPLHGYATATEDMNTLIQSYENDCAVLVYSEKSGVLYSYRSGQTLSGAGLIRLPYAYYLCTQLESGAHSLNETITYTEDWLRGKQPQQTGAGIIKNSELGTEYTLAQLLDYFLRYSDNIAFDMLVQTFGIDGFNEMLQSWGTNVTVSMSNLFPDVTPDFMRMCIQQLHQNINAGESWGIVWNALCESSQTHVREAIGGNIAVKYGFALMESGSIYNEVCYCDNLEPYILVIMANQPTTQIEKEFVGNLALYADNLVDEYYSLTYSIGNINADSTVDAVDASLILNASAHLGTDGESGLNHKQEDVADVDKNGVIDAVDASYILQYSAYIGAGETDDAETFFSKFKQTT